MLRLGAMLFPGGSGFLGHAVRVLLKPLPGETIIFKLRVDLFRLGSHYPRSMPMSNCFSERLASSFRDKVSHITIEMEGRPDLIFEERAKDLAATLPFRDDRIRVERPFQLSPSTLLDS